MEPILHLAVQEQEVGIIFPGEPLEEVVPGEPILHLAVQEQEVGMVVSEEQPPSQKGDLLVICIRIPTPCWISPRHWWRASGGCSQLMECDLPAEILNKLMQFLVS